MSSIIQISWCYPLELSKNDFERFSDDVCQEIESSSVWHSANSFLSSVGLDGVHGSFHAWNECITSIKTKSFERIEFDIYEITKLISIHNPLQNFEFSLFWNRVKLFIFDFVSDPIALISIWNMHVFDSNSPTISSMKLVTDFT